jgi:hypothetical protein
MAENALQAKSVSLEETNTALKILLKNVEEAKRELEENVVTNIKTLVMCQRRRENVLNMAV